MLYSDSASCTDWLPRADKKVLQLRQNILSQKTKNKSKTEILQIMHVNRTLIK